MATYKTTSYKTVIAKVIRDFNMTGNNWKSDSIEWIGEVIRAIGFHAGFEKKSCDIMINNHKCTYPCDFESLLMIEYLGNRLPESSTQRYERFDRPTLGDPSFNEDAFPLLIGGTPVYQDVVNVSLVNGEYYIRNPDYIITSFPKGKITLHYQAYVTDEEGFPKVPDTYEVMECMAFYIMYKWLSKGNLHPAWNLQMVKMEYERFLGKAENRMYFPNIDKMDQFTNMWTRTVFDAYSPEKFYSGLENNQEIFGI